MLHSYGNHNLKTYNKTYHIYPEKRIKIYDKQITKWIVIIHKSCANYELKQKNSTLHVIFVGGGAGMT